MHLSAAGVPEAGNVLVYTKKTLIKTSYRELREEIVLSPDYYVNFTAQCRKRQGERQEVIERGYSSVLRENKGRQLPQQQRKGSSSKDSAGHVSFELD